MSGPRILAARLDNAGDVLLTGPAVRALDRRASSLTYLAGPAGAPAAAMLPGVGTVVVFDAPWEGDAPPPVNRQAVLDLVDEVAMLAIDEAYIFTSFHQSPLPLALALRLAGVPFVAATCVDAAGALLDVRARVGKKSTRSSKRSRSWKPPDTIRHRKTTAASRLSPHPRRGGRSSIATSSCTPAHPSRRARWART